MGNYEIGNKTSHTLKINAFIFVRGDLSSAM
jgi:hypothetical protein